MGRSLLSSLEGPKQRLSYPQADGEIARRRCRILEKRCLGRLARSRDPLATIGERTARAVAAISGAAAWMISDHIFCKP
jgi:hypothetical protein